MTKKPRRSAVRRRKPLEKRKPPAAAQDPAQELRIILENTSDFIYMHDTEGVFTHVSKAVQEISGYKVADWKKHYSTYLTDNPLNAQVVRNTEATLRTGKRLPAYKAEIRHKKGHPVMLEVRESPFLVDGKVAGIIGVARDITQEDALAQELARSSAQMKEAQRVAHFSTWELDLETDVGSRSASSPDILGANKKTGPTPLARFYKVVHPDDRKAVQNALDAARKPGGVYEAEYRIVRPSGEIRWVAAKGETYCEKTTGSLRMIGALQDITDRKTSEQATRESEDMFRTLALSAQDAVILMDHRGRVAFWNKAAERIFGYTAKHARGRDCHTLIALPEHADAFRKGIQRFITSGKGNVVGRTVEFAARRRGGEEFPASISVSAVKLGGTWQAIGVVRDVTDRVRAERALRERDQGYRKLLEGSREILLVFQTEPETREPVRFLEWNSAATQVLGFSDAEMRRLDPSDLLFAGRPWKGIREENAKKIKAPPLATPIRNEVRLKRKDGSAVDLLQDLIFIDGSTALCRCRELSAVRREEQERLRTQKLESLALIAGGIAHDFNNLLVSSFGGASLLKTGRLEGKKRDDILDQILGSLENAKDLASQLLSFTRGGLPVRGPVSLNTILKRSIELALRGSGIGISVDVPAALPRVLGDETQLGQVAYNLLINAAQASPGKGRVRVKARAVKDPAAHGLQAGRGYVRFTVSDDGPGIPREHRSKIFDPYFSTRGPGRGLGLAAAHMIVTRHDGVIRAESEAGKGAAFTVFLPAVKTGKKGTARAAAPKTAEPRKRKTPSLRILIMEDAPMVRDMLRSILNALGSEGVCVPDGDAALKAYSDAMRKGKGFDAAILDLTIAGGMGGKEAAKKLLALDSKAVLIVSSGYSDDPVMARHAKHGFQAALPKPYSVPKLQEVLEKLFPGRGSGR